MPNNSFEYYISSLARLASESDTPSVPIKKDNLSSKISQCIPSFHERYSTEVEPLIHFVWIGNISSTSCKFIQLWSDRNPDYSVVLWRLHFGLLASKVKVYLNQLTKNLQFPSLSSAQDAFYDHYESLKLDSINVDLTLLSFLELHNKVLYHEAKKEYIALIEREKQLSKQFDIRYIDQETGIFKNKRHRLNSYFTREIILRQNLACASDIFRLAVLYEHGGIYIDSDTMPCLNNLFPNCCQFYGENREEYRLLDAYKSQLVATELLNIDRQNAGGNLRAVIESLVPEAIEALEADEIRPRSIDQVAPLGRLRVYKDSIRLSSDRNVAGDFNNNLIAAHKHSRLIRIIIREMCARYRYLERNHLINSSKSSNTCPNTYYERLNNYRQDGDESGNFVTLELTGPILILEVTLGVAYRVFDLGPLSQETLGLLLHMPELGFAFPDQTMYTYHHLESTWM